MATIGTFTADKDGFTGTLRTLTLNVKVKLVKHMEILQDKKCNLVVLVYLV